MVAKTNPGVIRGIFFVPVWVRLVSGEMLSPVYDGIQDSKFTKSLT
jgi:hypothetical protein